MNIRYLILALLILLCTQVFSGGQRDRSGDAAADADLTEATAAGSYPLELADDRGHDQDHTEPYDEDGICTGTCFHQQPIIVHYGRSSKRSFVLTGSGGMV